MDEIKSNNHHDFTIGVPAQTLRRCIKQLKKMQKKKIHITDIFLTLCSLTGGGTIGALVAGLNINTRYWWVFYLLLPIISVSCLITYFFLQYLESSETRMTAKDILDELPDPDSTHPVYDEIIGTWSFESCTISSNKKSTGQITFLCKYNILYASGIIYGVSEQIIGVVSSIYCNYDPSRRNIMVIYRLSASNDNSSQDINECILSGILLNDRKKNRLCIKGNWFHLNGPVVSGTAILKKESE